MPLILLLLALQAQQDPPSIEDPMASVRTHPHGFLTNFGLGPELQYWLPRFRGHVRVDGDTSRGSDIRLVGDLGMSDRAAIPMIGGGEFEFVINRKADESTAIVLSAEYWGHGWEGYRSLSGPETLGNHSFAAGSPVESRFHLNVLTLDASVSHQEQSVRVGATLSLRGESANLHMDSPTVHAEESIGNLYWGGGVFLELLPLPFLFAGFSVKGFTNFDGEGDTGAGDFRGYGGVEWGPFRLEGGYRYWNEDVTIDKQHLHDVLYGPYVALSIILRF